MTDLQAVVGGARLGWARLGWTRMGWASAAVWLVLATGAVAQLQSQSQSPGRAVSAGVDRPNEARPSDSRSSEQRPNPARGDSPRSGPVRPDLSQTEVEPRGPRGRPDLEAGPAGAAPRRLTPETQGGRRTGRLEAGRGAESGRGADERAEPNGEAAAVRPVGHAEPELPVDAPPSQPPSLEQVTRGAPFALGLAVLSIVPTVLLMTTCYIRFSIVFGILRQGLGTPQFPPNSVMTALCLFLTCLVMRPVWQASYDRGFVPWLEAREQEQQPQLAPLVGEAIQPVRDYMSDQIERAGNSETVWMLVESEERTDGAADPRQPAPTSYDQIPLPTLAAAFVLSELKVGMVIGFQILLPFLVIDLTVGLLLSILGLQGLSAGQIALPFKLLLFILVDGWTLVVGRLMSSVGH